MHAWLPLQVEWFWRYSQSSHRQQRSKMTCDKSGPSTWPRVQHRSPLDRLAWNQGQEGHFSPNHLVLRGSLKENHCRTSVSSGSGLRSGKEHNNYCFCPRMGQQPTKDGSPSPHLSPWLFPLNVRSLSPGNRFHPGNKMLRHLDIYDRPHRNWDRCSVPLTQRQEV